MPITIDHEAATARLLKFLSVEGITGQEAAISKTIVAALKEAGVSSKAIRFDDANSRIPVPTQTGNLIATLPGTRKNAKPVLFMTHMDTVPLCAGAKPKLDGRRIVNSAATALGGDNRTGCAVLVTLIAELLNQKLPHPPLTFLFTVRVPKDFEELVAAKAFRVVPKPPPGKRFAIDPQKVELILVDR